MGCSGWMTMARLLRCRTWGTSGLDFVPETLPEKSRWYMPWRYGGWRGTSSASSSPRSGFWTGSCSKQRLARTGRGMALNKDPFGHAYLHS
jgi:hypothetical protein